uniref:Uncharacterized protein n=1 Tax=Trichobilharzia regenti TaxID=157069 RepID=A0AA85JNB8_TRIRE|nr:unnamed protein product [Trichobilharzia regenti]
MRRFSTTSSASMKQPTHLFPPSLPIPPYPAPDLIPVKLQTRRTSAPTTSHKCYYDINKSHRNNNYNNRNLDKHCLRTSENLGNLLPSEYSPDSPPQSLAGESISYSEFDSLFLANEHLSVNSSLTSKIQDCTTFRSNWSHNSEESLLTALVRCQKVTRKNMATKQNMSRNNELSVSNQNKLSVPEGNHSANCQNVVDYSQNGVKPCILTNITKEMISSSESEKHKTIRRRITIAGEHPSVPHSRKPTSLQQQQTHNSNHNSRISKRSSDSQNLGKVALAKQSWENYFTPKPPRIARNKTTEGERITRPVSVCITQDMGQYQRSSSVDCTYQDYKIKDTFENKTITNNFDKQFSNGYNEHLSIPKYKSISTPVSPIFSACDSPRTLSPAKRSTVTYEENRNIDCTESKHTCKGYLPRFNHPASVDDNLNCLNQKPDRLVYNTPELCSLEITNDRNSSSTLTLTENTTTTTKDPNQVTRLNQPTGQNTFNSNEISTNDSGIMKRLCTSDIHYPNFNVEEITENGYTPKRPLSVTIKRHCIQFPTLNSNDRKSSLSSTNSSNDYDNNNNINNNDDCDIFSDKSKNLIESKSPYATAENIQTDFTSNNHSHWSRLHVEKNRLLENLKVNLSNKNTPIDHLTLPSDKRSTLIRSYSADNNPNRAHSRNNSSPAGIERSESFHKVINHISHSVKSNQKPPSPYSISVNYNDNKSGYSSSPISPISVSVSLSPRLVQNDSIHLSNNKKHYVSSKECHQLKTNIRQEKISNKQSVNLSSVSPHLPKICANKVVLCQSKSNNCYEYGDDSDEDDNENSRVDKVNCTVEKMSLSPAARRYEEHVLATVSGKAYNKPGHQIFFNNNHNNVNSSMPYQNLLKKVKISPDYLQNNNKLITTNNNYNNCRDYDEESDSVVDQLQDDLNYAEIWREKLGAITRWKREVDKAMLAGETDIKEILCNPETSIYDSCVENKYSLINTPNNNHEVNTYLQPLPVQVNPFSPNELCPSPRDLQRQFLPCNIIPLKQSQTFVKPFNGSGTEQCQNVSFNNVAQQAFQIRPEALKNLTPTNNLIQNNQICMPTTQKNYQQPNYSVPAKVVIHPNMVANDYLNQRNNGQLDGSPQFNPQYQQIRLKAPIPHVSTTRQRVNSGGAILLQPVQQTPNHTNMPYYTSNIPVNREISSQSPTHLKHESNLIIPNEKSSPNVSNKNPTIRTFRNFFTPKLRRKTYELDKTEPVVYNKQNLFSSTNTPQNSTAGPNVGNNARENMTGNNFPVQNNQYKKITPSTSYTDALNLAVAANAALSEAFHQSTPPTDTFQRTSSTNHITPLKTQKCKTQTSTVLPESLNTDEQAASEISPLPNEIVQTENKNRFSHGGKFIKHQKNMSLSPISSTVQSSQGDKSPIGKWTGTNKSQNLTVEQIFNTESKNGSPKPLINDKKPSDSINPSTETRRPQGRLRSTLRHAVTLSPCRRKPDLQSEQWNGAYLEPGSLALSSGFVSAGSIVNAAEDSTWQMNKDEPPGSSPKVKAIPPPVNVYDYPIVTNLEKDLNTIDCLINDTQNTQDEHVSQIKSHQDLKMSSNPTNINSVKQQRSVDNRIPPLQTLPPCKLLLGRVASNEDICIETETPFAFNIAATDKEICITRVASVGDLEYQQQQQQPQIENQEDPSSTNVDGQKYQNSQSINKKKKKGIPISLRLTFGSESKLNKSTSLNTAGEEQAITSQMKNYRAMYYVDIPQGCRTGELRRKTNRHKSASSVPNVTRYSLPCISYCEELPKPISLLPPLTVEKNR